MQGEVELTLEYVPPVPCPALLQRSQPTRRPPLAGAPGDLPVVPALGSDVPLHASEDDPAVIEHVLLSLLLRRQEHIVL